MWSKNLIYLISVHVCVTMLCSTLGKKTPFSKSMNLEMHFFLKKQNHFRCVWPKERCVWSKELGNRSCKLHPLFGPQSLWVPLLKHIDFIPYQLSLHFTRRVYNSLQLTISFFAQTPNLWLYEFHIITWINKKKWKNEKNEKNEKRLISSLVIRKSRWLLNFKSKLLGGIF